MKFIPLLNTVFAAKIHESAKPKKSRIRHRGGRGKMGQWGKIGQMQFFADNSKAWHPSVKFKPSLSYFAKL